MNQFIKLPLVTLLFIMVSNLAISQSVRLVKDINIDGNGVFNSDEKYFAAVGENLFFAASDGISGEELWITDGSEGSTRMVKDIFPGAESSELHGLIEHNGKCYFFADNGVNGKELWSSDGTESGTQMIVDINSGSSSSVFSSFEYLTAFNGSLYFEAFNGDDDLLWEVDSNDNASLLSGLPSETFTSGITGIHVMDDVLYFFRKLTFDGLVLYKYDGNNLTEIEKFGLGNIITHMDNSEGILYYAIQEGFDDIIWAYDSNSNENNMLTTPSSTIHSAIAHKSNFYYSIDGDPTLYLLNSTDTESTVLSETSFDFADEPSAFEIFNDMVYYYGESSNDGIHRTDGTPNGTELLFDINKVFGDRNGIHSIGEQLLIAGEMSFTQGEELFISDGESSLDLFSDIYVGNQDSEPRAFINVGENRTFFTAETGDEGRELWMYSTSGLATSDLLTNSFLVYPSLVTNSISIDNKSGNMNSEAFVSIFNAQGALIRSGKLTTLQNINTSKWMSGIYHININVQGKKETHKVIKI